MKRFITLTVVIATIVISSLSAGVVAVNAQAEESYSGTLVRHTDPQYTHRLEGQNVNLILSSYYNDWEGMQVNLRVRFHNGGFTVVSLTPQDKEMQTIVGTGEEVNNSVVSYQGVLETNPESSYTHTLRGQNINLTLGSRYSELEGQEVEVKVQFTNSGKFTVISITKV